MRSCPPMSLRHGRPSSPRAGFPAPPLRCRRRGRRPAGRPRARDRAPRTAGERGSPAPQHRDPGRDPSPGGVAPAGDPVRVHGPWPVHAHGHPDAVPVEQIAPGPIDQGRIRLDLMCGAGRPVGEQLAELPDTDRERLSRMPEDPDLVPRVPPAGHGPGGGAVDGGRHVQALGPVGQVAISAVKIAEGRRLHHQNGRSQPESRPTVTAGRRVHAHPPTVFVRGDFSWNGVAAERVNAVDSVPRALVRWIPDFRTIDAAS